MFRDFQGSAVGQLLPPLVAIRAQQHKPVVEESSVAESPARVHWGRG
jgi:hypothetical protein